MKWLIQSDTLLKKMALSLANANVAIVGTYMTFVFALAVTFATNFLGIIADVQKLFY